MSQSNFTGEVTTDFMKKVIIPDDRKDTLIDYASSDFLSLRNSIIEYVKAVYPLDYQNFSETDLGIMLVEVVAYMGSVLSLKADMLANESFLATARNRSNVQKLLELVGVRMRGPLAAAANAQLTIPIALGASQNAITIPPSGRTITITSPEDGGRLTYTLYKISAGRIVDSNADSTVYLNKEEANDPTSAEVWTNIALLEGAFVVQRGTFTSYDSIKSLTLNQSPVIEGSIQVFVDAPNVPNASGSFSQVESLFFASGATDKIFQTNLNESFGGTIVFGKVLLMQQLM